MDEIHGFKDSTLRSIPFTQYLLPDGKTMEIVIDRSAEVENMARGLLHAGMKFEIEILSTGAVSMTCEKSGGQGDEDDTLAHILCINGPEVLRAVDMLIVTAFKEAIKK